MRLFYHLMRTRLQLIQWDVIKVCVIPGTITNIKIFSTSMEDKFANRIIILTTNRSSDGHLRQAVFIITVKITHCWRRNHHVINQNFYWSLIMILVERQQLSPAMIHSLPFIFMIGVSSSTILVQVKSVDNSYSKIMNKFTRFNIHPIINTYMLLLKLH